MSDALPGRSLHLALSYEYGGVGWRRATSDVENLHTLDYYLTAALRAEHHKLDAVFRADTPYLYPESVDVTASANVEAIVLLSAIAARTHRIGVIATASTSFKEPFDIARTLATLDHISGGRAGWNVVTSAFGERNFGIDTLAPQEDRYRRAQEFLDITRRLWRSWEADAVVADRASGRYADPEKIHRIDHVGEFFRVEGPLDIPRSPQGEPVIVQAGASGTGRRFAASNAEVIFTAAQTRDDAIEFRSDIHRIAAEEGRDGLDIRVLPGLRPVVAATEAEARELDDELNSFIDHEAGREAVEKALGFVDLSGVDLDDPVPAERLAGDVRTLQRRQSRPALFRRLAVEERLTLRQLIEVQARTGGHKHIAGTPETIADFIEDWYRAGACDGFIVVPTVANSEEFLDGVVPLLQERGLFRTDYEGTTLREHLRLPQPAERHPLGAERRSLA